MKFLTPNRMYKDSRIVPSDGTSLHIFEQKDVNALGMNDSFKIFFIERIKWLYSCRWNWRELGRFKRTDGILLQIDLYDMIRDLSGNSKRNKVAVYMSSEDRFYWTHFEDLRKFVFDVGMVFDLEDSYGQPTQTVVGFPKDLFETVV